jgi:hypothetical protein
VILPFQDKIHPKKGKKQRNMKNKRVDHLGNGDMRGVFKNSQRKRPHGDPG